MDRQLLGHQSRARGQSFEDQLDFLHSYYDKRDQAFLRHNGTQAVKRGGTWVPQKSLPDFEGMITCRGCRHVAFDAKHTSGLVYNHPKDKLHQTDYLWRIADKGGIAFLLILVDGPDGDWTKDQGFIALPQLHWQEYFGKGFTIRLDEPGAFLSPVPRWSDVQQGYIPDWIWYAMDLCTAQSFK